MLTLRISCNISVLALYVLLIHFTSLRRHVGGDHEDLSLRDLEHFARIVGRDGRSGDLEREVVRT
jgi:hypothetical protein